MARATYFSFVNRGKWKGKEVALKRIQIPPGYLETAEDLKEFKEISVLKFVILNIIYTMRCM